MTRTLCGSLGRREAAIEHLPMAVAGDRIRDSLRAGQDSEVPDERTRVRLSPA